MASAPDEQIALRAKETSAVLLSRDLDFADIRRYPPSQYAGIVVLRLADDATAREIVAQRGLSGFSKSISFLTHLKGAWRSLKTIAYDFGRHSRKPKHDV
jgi:hypothetical protein